MEPRDLVRIVSIPKDGGVGDAVLVTYRLRLVILDPPSVKIFYGMLQTIKTLAI